MASLKTTLDIEYQYVNQNINQGNNHHIYFDKPEHFIIHTPKFEKNNSDSISDLFTETGFVPIIQVLKEVNHACEFADAFKHYSIKHHKLKPDIDTIIAGIMSQGHNLGINKISNISVGINANTLRQVVTWFFTPKNLQAANNKIIALINKLSLSNLFKYKSNGICTSSDGQKYQVTVDSLNQFLLRLILWGQALHHVSSNSVSTIFMDFLQNKLMLKKAIKYCQAEPWSM